MKGTSLASAVAAAGVPRRASTTQIASGGLPAALRGGQVTAIVLGIENAITERRKDPDAAGGRVPRPARRARLGGEEGRRARSSRPSTTTSRASRRTPTWSRLVVKYFGDEAPEILKRAREEAER